MSRTAEQDSATTIWDLSTEDETSDSGRTFKRRKTAHGLNVARTPPSKQAFSNDPSPEVRSSCRKRYQTTKVQDTVPSADIDLYIDESQGTLVDTLNIAENGPEISSTMDSLYTEGTQETVSDKSDADRDVRESSLEVDVGIDPRRPTVGHIRQSHTRRPLRTIYSPELDTMEAHFSRAFQQPPFSPNSNIVEPVSNTIVDGITVAAPVAKMITSSAEERYRQPDLETSESHQSLGIPTRPRGLTVTPTAEEGTQKRNPAPSQSLEPHSIPANKSQLTFWIVKSRTPVFYQSKWAKGTLRGQTMQSMVDSTSKIMRTTNIESITFQLHMPGKMIEYVCERDDEAEFERMKDHFQDEMKEAIRKNGNQQKAFEIFIEPVVEVENVQVGSHECEDAALDEFF